MFLPRVCRYIKLFQLRILYFDLIVSIIEPTVNLAGNLSEVRDMTLMKSLSQVLFSLSLLVLSACQIQATGKIDMDYDTIIRNGMVYDGSGAEPYTADIGIRDDRIATIGELDGKTAQHEVDVRGMAVAPGFINMLSWAVTSLIEDGRGLSDISQGVTLEVMGEGFSMGPLPEINPRSSLEIIAPDQDLEIQWRSLGEYLSYLERKGVSPNIASFVGASTVRLYAMGQASSAPNDGQLEIMRKVVGDAMEEGAMGLGAALFYVPGNFANTDELIELAHVVNKYDGMFIAHIRSESFKLLNSLDEMITIARETGVNTEIYHFKAASQANWHALDDAIEKINSSRAEGLSLTANIYTYTASATGLNAILPVWVREGGVEEMLARLEDPELRQRVIDDLRGGISNDRNRLAELGAENVMLAGFTSKNLQNYTGMRLSEIAEIRGATPAETVVDLLREDHSRILAVYFSMSEDNLRKKIALPWVSFCSDAAATTPDDSQQLPGTHPREFGSFARLLAKYVREERVISLQEAVRRLTSLPATNLKLHDRGMITEGYFADIVVFDPDNIQDHATFENPTQLATGVLHVFVNGEHVLANGAHTGALPGRFVRGPGWNPEKYPETASVGIPD